MMSNERENLPGTIREGPDEPEWIDDTSMDILVVRRYDTDDILVGNQYFAIVHDDTIDSGFIVSSMAKPSEPVPDR